MLRNPADVVPSLHAEMVYSGVEPERNLVRALDLEPERLHAGRPVSPRQNLLQSVHYLTYMRRLPGQIERYRAVFGPSRVKVVLLDDLKRSPEAAYADVLSFLDVDPHYRPDFSVRNAHKVVRNEALRNWMAQNQMRLGRIRRRFFKRSLGITDRLKRLNTRYTAREEIDPELRGRIVEALRPAVRELEDVLERDLSGWRG